jgi:two-component system CheB/CheR fusion protein
MKYIFNLNQAPQDQWLERIVRSAEQFYEDLIATIREPLVVLDSDLRVVDANPAFYQTFQVSPGETEGHLLYELGNGQWDVPRLRELLEHLPTEPTEVQDFEVDHNFESIGRKVMILNSRQIHRQEGGSSLILLAIEDITEHKRTEEEYRERIRRLQEHSHRVVSELVFTGFAHQLNNPLGIVLGYSELALEEELSEKVHDYLQTIQHATTRASQAVRDNLSLIASSSPAQARIDTSIFLERLVILASEDLRFGNIPVSRRVSPDLPAISADPFQLLEALLNIVTNAQQACAEARGHGEIIIDAYELEGKERIRISIKDNGPGIPPEQLERIFDPFFTTREAVGGSGLGLSITSRIIQQYGGELWAESVVGAGTTFHIELPTSAPVKEAETESLEPAEPEVNRKHVLVVNNEPDFLRLLSLTLQPEGHVVDRAKDGNEAWQMVQHQEYDRILMNVLMPGMNGQQLYRLIKDHRPDLARRCIFMTGGKSSPDIREFIDGTGNPCLGKSFTLEEVRKLVLQAPDQDNP